MKEETSNLAKQKKIIKIAITQKDIEKHRKTAKNVSVKLRITHIENARQSKVHPSNTLARVIQINAFIQPYRHVGAYIYTHMYVYVNVSNIHTHKCNLQLIIYSKYTFSASQCHLVRQQLVCVYVSTISYFLPFRPFSFLCE